MRKYLKMVYVIPAGSPNEKVAIGNLFYLAGFDLAIAIYLSRRVRTLEGAI
jgi:hypothetical protein